MAERLELRLIIPAPALPRLETHPLLAGNCRQAEATACESRYFDTAKLDLRRAGVTLSTHHAGNGWRQSLARPATASGGLSATALWEQDYAGCFDFAALPNDELRQLLEKKRERLQPVFKLLLRQQTRVFSPRPAVSIRVTIASGSVVAGDRESPVCELLLELQQGNAADLRALAIALATDLPLLPIDSSLAERGYRLLQQDAPRPLKAGSSPLVADLSPGESFAALARQGLRAWQGNLHGALATADPEFVHQFRVALRRLDTLIKVFKPALPGKFSATWLPALKEQAVKTGEVRDLEVMRESILLPALGKADSAAGQAAIGRAIAACEAARRAADASREHLANGLPLLAFARDLEQLAAGKGGHRIAAFAEKRLAKLHARAVRRFAAVVKEPTPSAAHRLRIALKHLRYGGEFFAPLFDETGVQAFCKDIAALQDELGFINDLHVALARLERWSQHDPTLNESRNCLAASYAGQLDGQFTAALRRAESVLTRCLPWCSECERRGFKSLRERLRQGVAIKLG